MTSLDVNLLGFLVQVNATIGELMVNPNTPLKSHGLGGHRPSRVNALVRPADPAVGRESLITDAATEPSRCRAGAWRDVCDEQPTVAEPEH